MRTRGKKLRSMRRSRTGECIGEMFVTNRETHQIQKAEQTNKRVYTSGNWEGGRSKEGGFCSWCSLFLRTSHHPNNNLTLKGCFMRRISYIGGLGGGNWYLWQSITWRDTSNMCCYPTILSFPHPSKPLDVQNPFYQQKEEILKCSFLSFPLINGFHTAPHFSILPFCHNFSEIQF